MKRINRSDAWRRGFIGRHGGRCHYCNRIGTLDCGPGGKPWHIDHMTALAVGGSDTEDNLALACERCNAAKHTKPYRLFKELARSAYWVPDEGGPSEAQLDHLAELHARVLYPIYSGQWRESDRYPGFVEAVLSGLISDHTGLPLPSAESPVLYAREVDGEAERVVQFLAAAYALLPELIAEINLLRSKEWEWLEGANPTESPRRRAS